AEFFFSRVNPALNLLGHHWDHWAFAVLRLDCLRFPQHRDRQYNRVSWLNPLGQRLEFALEPFPVPAMCYLGLNSLQPNRFNSFTLTLSSAKLYYRKAEILPSCTRNRVSREDNNSISTFHPQKPGFLTDVLHAKVQRA
ncbi:MAG: hypothetical protein RIG27_13690, partial [Coleofasciculus sp. F4-SAH-05]